MPKPATRTEGACAASSLAFREEVFAIASRFYDVGLVGGVEEMSKRSVEEVTEDLGIAGFPDESKHGFTFPGLYATRAAAYFEKYGLHGNITPIAVGTAVHGKAGRNEPDVIIPYHFGGQVNAFSNWLLKSPPDESVCTFTVELP